MRILCEIELFEFVGRNWIKSTGLWHIYCVFAVLKMLGSLLYKEGVTECFLNRTRLIVFPLIFVDATKKIYCTLWGHDCC